MFAMLYCAFLLMIPIVTGTAMAQASSSLMTMTGPPVVVDGLGYGENTFSQSDKPLLAPKVQEQVDEGEKALVSARYEDAQSEFQQAYRLAPGNPEVNFLIGVTSMALNDLTQADTYLSRAGSLDPRNPATLTALGILRLKQSNLSAAIGTLEAAISLNQKTYLPHLALARAFLAEHKFSESLKEAQRALRWGRGSANHAKFILAKALAGLGRNQEALRPLQEFVRECPNDPRVKDARQLIAQLSE